MNTKFERNKIKRLLDKSGTEYKFLRVGKDEFGEPDGEPYEVCSIKAIYHKSNSQTNIYVKNGVGEAATVRTKKEPMLLCLYEDTTSLVSGDYVMINGKRHNVTGVIDVQEWNIIADISLEVVDSGD